MLTNIENLEEGRQTSNGEQRSKPFSRGSQLGSRRRCCRDRGVGLIIFLIVGGGIVLFILGCIVLVDNHRIESDGVTRQCTYTKLPNGTSSTFSEFGRVDKRKRAACTEMDAYIYCFEGTLDRPRNVIQVKAVMPALRCGSFGGLACITDSEAIDDFRESFSGSETVTVHVLMDSLEGGFYRGYTREYNADGWGACVAIGVLVVLCYCWFSCCDNKKCNC